MYLYLCLHLLITSDLLFSMLSSSCRAIASFSLGHGRHCLEIWLYDLRVPKISQDIFLVLFVGIIFQYSFDNSLLVWYLMLLNVFFMVCISALKYCFTNAIINFCVRIFFVWCDHSHKKWKDSVSYDYGVILALYKTLLVRHFSIRSQSTL